MDPVEPWIDGDAVRRLAAQLLSSPTGSEIADSPDAGFGPGFEGFTSASGAVESRDSERAIASPDVPTPQEQPPERVPEIIHRPEPQPAQQVEHEVPSEEISAKPFLSASGEGVETTDSADQAFRRTADQVEARETGSRRGPLMDRLMRFRDWLTRHAGARSVFVLDRDGQPVLDDPAYAKLHFLARSLSQAYRPVPGQPGNVHVKVGSDAYLVVIPVDTAFGCLVLGTVLPRPLDAASVEIVAKALLDSAKPGSA